MLKRAFCDKSGTQEGAALQIARVSVCVCLCLFVCMFVCLGAPVHRGLTCPEATSTVPTLLHTDTHTNTHTHTHTHIAGLRQDCLIMLLFLKVDFHTNISRTHLRINPRVLSDR